MQVKRTEWWSLQRLRAEGFMLSITRSAFGDLLSGLGRKQINTVGYVTR